MCAVKATEKRFMCVTPFFFLLSSDDSDFIACCIVYLMAAMTNLIIFSNQHGPFVHQQLEEVADERCEHHVETNSLFLYFRIPIQAWKKTTKDVYCEPIVFQCFICICNIFIFMWMHKDERHVFAVSNLGVPDNVLATNICIYLADSSVPIRVSIFPIFLV